MDEAPADCPRCTLGGTEVPFESDMAWRRAVSLVEAVSLAPSEIGRQLDAVAAGPTGRRNGSTEQLAADAVPSELGMHVERLDLGAATTALLEVPEHHELAHPDDLSRSLGHPEVVSVCGLVLPEGRPVVGQRSVMFQGPIEGAMTQELDQAGYITGTGAADGDRVHR